MRSAPNALAHKTSANPGAGSSVDGLDPGTGTCFSGPARMILSVPFDAGRASATLHSQSKTDGRADRNAVGPSIAAVGVTSGRF
jgi:hypothetical protein